MDEITADSCRKLAKGANSIKMKELLATIRTEAASGKLGMFVKFLPEHIEEGLKERNFIVTRQSYTDKEEVIYISWV